MDFIIILRIRNLIDKPIPIQIWNRLNPRLQRNVMLNKLFDTAIITALAYINPSIRIVVFILYGL